MLAATLGAALFAVPACGSSHSGTPDAGGGGNTGTDAANPASVDAGACSPDPLKTGLPPLFNGVSVDIDDCPILEFTAKYNEPDAMIFKAIIYVESRFVYDAVGCTGNSGCCPASNWTPAECGCLGSMQTGPSCGTSSTLGLLADGHPDLDTTRRHHLSLYRYRG